MCVCYALLYVYYENKYLFNSGCKITKKTVNVTCF